MEHTVEHTLDVPAAARVMYGLVADVSRWPLIFGPAVHVDVLRREQHEDGTIRERFRIHALVGETLRSWTSRRRLDPDGLVITFDQEHSAAPLAAMSGRWEFRPAPGGTTVVLAHRFSPTDDTEESVRWITAALDANSNSELGALARVGSAAVPIEELFISCEDSALAPPGEGAFDFIAHAERWADVLPHVEQVDLLDLGDGAQDLSLVTRAGDRVHRTRSIRLCAPPTTITYKQLSPPGGLMGHSGVWEFRDGEEPTVTSRHTALLDPAALTAAGDLAEARDQLLQALTNASKTTLALAVSQAGTAVGVRP